MQPNQEVQQKKEESLVYHSFSRQLHSHSQPCRRSATTLAHIGWGGRRSWTRPVHKSLPLQVKKLHGEKTNGWIGGGFCSINVALKAPCTYCRWQAAHRYHLRSRRCRHRPTVLWHTSHCHTGAAEVRMSRMHLWPEEWEHAVNFKGPLFWFWIVRNRVYKKIMFQFGF